MKSTIQTCLLSLFALIALYSSGQELTKATLPYIHPFDSPESAALLDHMDQVAENALIIGLGEVSHYTKECYTIKHQIISRLMAKGYDGLVLETDFGQALLWDDYVTKGEGDIDKLISESGWFTYRTQEFKGLLTDIREHNKTAAKPFRIFGMEMTTMHNNLPWLAEYVKNHADGSTDLLAALETERPNVAFQPHERADVMAYWELYYQLLDFFAENEAALIQSGGAERYATAQRMTEITRQYATYIAQDDFLLQVEFRDQFSARNTAWCMDQLGEESRIAIWAHNGHVTKKSVVSNYDILGHYLVKWFGNAYYSVGFTFNEGAFGAFSSNGFKEWEFPPVTTPSLTREMAAMNSPYLLFDIRAALSGGADPTLFAGPVPIRTDVSESFNENADRMMEIDLSNSYDCLIYIDHTHYPTTIEWTR